MRLNLYTATCSLLAYGITAINLGSAMESSTVSADNFTAFEDANHNVAQTYSGLEKGEDSTKKELKKVDKEIAKVDKKLPASAKGKNMEKATATGTKPSMKNLLKDATNKTVKKGEKRAKAPKATAKGGKKLSKM